MTLLKRRIVASSLWLIAPGMPALCQAELFIDFGAAAHIVDSRIAGPEGPIDNQENEAGVHLGFGGRRAFNEKADYGFRIELDSVDSNTLLSLRAFDYRRHPSDRLAYGFFFGAARLDVATPAYGYYLGVGMQIKSIFANTDLGIDFSYGDSLARDNLLPEDTPTGSPDNFYDVSSIKLYLSRRF